MAVPGAVVPKTDGVVVVAVDDANTPVVAVPPPNADEVLAAELPPNIDVVEDELPNAKPVDAAVVVVVAAAWDGVAAASVDAVAVCPKAAVLAEVVGVVPNKDLVTVADVVEVAVVSSVLDTWVVVARAPNDVGPVEPNTPALPPNWAVVVVVVAPPGGLPPNLAG